MRKLLALLLACMMALPACALAETYEYALSVDLSDDAINGELAQLADLLPEDEAGIAGAMLKIMDGIALRIVAQEDAFVLYIDHGSNELIDISFQIAGDLLYIGSTLCPDYVLTVENTMPQQVALDEADLEAAAMEAAVQALNWLGTLEPTVTRGAFIGDAYEGGTVCTTYTLTDSDLAGLVRLMLTDGMQEAIRNAMGEQALAELVTANDKAADEDRHAYLLRIIENDEGFVGLALTVFRESSQIGTLSVGLSEKDLTIVAGLGLDEQNYWYKLTNRMTEHNGVIYLSGDAWEWLAPRDEAFAYASAANEAKAQFEWNCQITQSGNRCLYEAQLTDVTQSMGVGMRGSIQEEPCKLEAELFDLLQTIRVKMTVQLATPIAPLAGTAQAVSLDEVDAELFDQLYQEIASRLMIRLIKVLPMDLILELMPMFMQ